MDVLAAYREVGSIRPADGCHDGMQSLVERGREWLSDKPSLGSRAGCSTRLIQSGWLVASVLVGHRLGQVVV